MKCVTVRTSGGSDDGSEVVFKIVVSTDKPARHCSKSEIKCNHKVTRTYSSLDIRIDNKVTQDECLNTL